VDAMLFDEFPKEHRKVEELEARLAQRSKKTSLPVSKNRTQKSRK